MNASKAAADQLVGSCGQPSRTVLRLAELSFLFFVLALAWMKAPVPIRGLGVLPMDFLFVLAAGLWAVALLLKQTVFRWDHGYWILGAYLVAMAASAFASQDPQKSAFKLLTQLYLVALPVLAFNLIRSASHLRRTFIWWLAGSSGVALLGAATLLLFPFVGANSVLDWPLHHFGTLPPGPYPRLELTFEYPALLANYLGTSLMLLLVGHRLNWFNRKLSVAVGTAIFASAFFALTPGFGGVLFMLAVWFWYVARARHPRSAAAALAIGCAMPALAVAIASISPMIYRSAPYLIDVGSFGVLAPSVRWLAWSEAVHNFLAEPLLGRGIGVDSVSVPYEVRDCTGGCITDAHNTFLNIAAQTGIVGLAGLTALIWFVARRMQHAIAQGQPGVMVFGLSVTWISGMVMQGLVGSFEDARHLWVLLGLILSAESLQGELSDADLHR